MSKFTRPNSNQLAKLREKIEAGGLGAADWTFAPRNGKKILNGFPITPMVAAGDGGLWIPVYVYVPKPRRKKKAK